MEQTFIQNIQAAFGNEKATLIVKSPGRINLIGEHMDYNGGFSLPAAITQAIYCGIKKSSEKEQFKATALDKKETLTYALNNEELFPVGAWQNYVIGVVQEIQIAGKKLSGFELVFMGNIPQGAGLSSSAALENSIVFALNSLFNLGFSKKEMILISQKAEHNYAGVQCGIMDQYASMFGKKNSLIKLDFLRDAAEYIPFSLPDHDLVLINSNVSHELAFTEYNVRKQECDAALKKIQSVSFNVKSYQDLVAKMIRKTPYALTANEYDRALFVVEEISRTIQASSYLESIKNESSSLVKILGELLLESHEGLQFLYSVTCPETDFLVEKAKDNVHVLGARQMGGGFGGCTINLIDKGAIDSYYTAALQEEYFNKFNKELSLIPIEIGDGTKIIWEDGAIA